MITARGGSPDLVVSEYLWTIKDAIAHQPRTLQKAIGPSEIGTPCTRRLGYRLAQVQPRTLPPNWKATVGTGTHLWLETVFGRDNNRCVAEGGFPRWLIETRVPVTDTISGKCDLFDLLTATVIDHKTCGPTRLAHYRRHGPGDQYRVQAHLYGLGWTRLGLAVDTVMIIFLPRDGELRDAVAWHEPFRPDVAEQALARLDGVARLLALGQPVGVLPTSDAFCFHCPWFKINSSDTGVACPGDPSIRTSEPALTVRT